MVSTDIAGASAALTDPEHKRQLRRAVSGSVPVSMEWARWTRSRGLVASWPQCGVPCGLSLANLAVLAFSAMSGDQFLSWGWRVPFLLSIVLVGVGLWIRLGILETPV